MVYEDYTNKELIDKSYILLDKLNKNNLWDKDTLVIGLDKSVRPLAYILKKISDKEKRETPDIRFFNYSRFDYNNSEKELKTISSYMKNKINPKKLSKYKNVVILDEYVWTGESMNNMSKILDNYFSRLKNKPNISFAALNSSMNSFYGNSLIYADSDSTDRVKEDQTGIRDSFDTYKPFLGKEQRFMKSIKTPNGFYYSNFIKKRKRLSRDINEYLQEKQKDNENSLAGKSLEKAVQVLSIISFLFGIVISYDGITGNVIGNSPNISNIRGIILIILGFLGLIVSNKFNK